ncbi:MAG TPA: metallopeptidase family protein [Verrucomicrobiae bacterium]|nr:metallopeptidase family protein [Verrucomicrobiae bacterium]
MTKRRQTGTVMQDNLPSRRYTAPPSLEDMEAMAVEAFASIPAELRQNVANVVIQIADFPDDETSGEMDLETPFDLLGLYRGVDLARKSVGDVAQDMDMVFLYRRPILDYWCETGEDLKHVIRHVLIHEIGHHFGLSDEDMERIEEEAAEG